MNITQAQAYLNQLKLEGQTATGQVKVLKVTAIPQPKKSLEEYLLIRHQAEGGVEIKGKFIEDKHPTEKEKLLFLLGEACYAVAFHTHDFKPEEVVSLAEKEKVFDDFMRALTKTVKTYHAKGEKDKK